MRGRGLWWLGKEFRVFVVYKIYRNILIFIYFFIKSRILSNLYYFVNIVFNVILLYVYVYVEVFYL